MTTDELYDEVIALLEAFADSQDHLATPGLYPQFSDVARGELWHAAKMLRLVANQFRVKRGERWKHYEAR